MYRPINKYFNNIIVNDMAWSELEDLVNSLKEGIVEVKGVKTSRLFLLSIGD